MSCPEDLLYTADHEWARLEDLTVTVGITEHAQESLGDIVFVELPEGGQELVTNDAFGVVESVKAVNDLYAPCDGVVLQINEALEDQPELVNEDPYGDGWLVKLTISSVDDLSHLMNPDEYQVHVDAES
jgi:glycine cleavage system H protein